MWWMPHPWRSGWTALWAPDPPVHVPVWCTGVGPDDLLRVSFNSNNSIILTHSNKWKQKPGQLGEMRMQTPQHEACTVCDARRSEACAAQHHAGDRLSRKLPRKHTNLCRNCLTNPLVSGRKHWQKNTIYFSSTTKTVKKVFLFPSPRPWLSQDRWSTQAREQTSGSTFIFSVCLSHCYKISLH